LKKNTFLITGATGFIGSALTRSLLEAGYCVMAVDLIKGGYLDEYCYTHSNFRFLLCDLYDINPDDFKQYQISGIFHLASILPSSEKPGYQEFLGGNADIFFQLLKVAKSINSEFVVCTSTGSVFGNPPPRNVLTEIEIPCPTNYYGLSKYLSERLLEIELRDTGIKGIVIRFPSVYGRNDSIGIVNSFFSSAIKNESIEVFSNGERFRNLVYLQDAVKMLKLITLNLPTLSAYEIFNCGSMDSLRTLEIAQLIKTKLSSKSQIVKVAKFPPTDWDVWVDTSKAQKMLGFEPSTIDEGLTRYVQERLNEI
jgi:nucleoside-diphosphate-sugar epimerase